MSYFDNFKTLITKPQKDHSVLSFNDTKIYPIVHFPSCPNLKHPVPEKLRFSEHIIKEASEARIRLDHIDQEILINNDKLITKQPKYEQQGFHFTPCPAHRLQSGSHAEDGDQRD